MIGLVSCITQQHNWPLLIIAICLCAAGNLAAVFMLSRGRQRIRAHRDLWLAVSGVVLGGTIWATHFTAMLSYNIPVSYQLTETAMSILVAIGISCLSTFTSVYLPGRMGALAAGVFLGLAIASMHAIGLSAISASTLIQTRSGTTVAAWLLAGGFAVFAMLVLYRRIDGIRLICAGLLIAVAVCSHHLVSMSGPSVVPLYPDTTSGLTFVHRVGIAIGVCVVSSLLIATGVAALFFDRHLTDVKGLANATFEAVVLTRAGMIVHANERFSSLIGKSLGELKSLALREFLVERHESQGVIKSKHALIPVEVVEGVIEYQGRETSVYGLRDISERLEAHRRLDHLASHDPLTGLLNRRAFNTRSEQAIAEAMANATDLALLTLDLDRFKSINDVYGHADGDLVLRQIAEVLGTSFKEPAIVGRVGGDEFSVLLPGRDLFEAQQSASFFMAQFKVMFAAHDKAATLGASVGIAAFPDHGSELEQLQSNADAALYRAKSQGRGRICAFNRTLDQQIRQQRRLEEELRRAAGADQLFLLYQPIVEAASGVPKGYEALLRWHHPVHGILSPAVFIEAAEESGSIVEIGKWVLQEACRRAASWDERLFLAVNISPRQLLTADLLDHVTTALDASGLSPERLELEVTETSLLEDRVEIAQRLYALKSLGIKLVMDDYGSGYSSMTNLRRYPFDKVKIDRAYVAALDDDPVAEVIIDCALALGRSLGLAVVIEGVETEGQRMRMASKGADQIQGFLFGRPGAHGGQLGTGKKVATLESYHS